MSNPAEIPFSVWRKIAMASWRQRKDPMIAATLDVDAARYSTTSSRCAGPPVSA